MLRDSPRGAGRAPEAPFRAQKKVACAWSPAPLHSVHRVLVTPNCSRAPKRALTPGAIFSAPWKLAASRAPRLALYALAALGVVGVCLHAVFDDPPKPALPTAPLPPTPPSPPREAPVTKSSVTTTATRVVTAEPAALPRAAGPRPESPRPHPLTPAHERIFRENHFIGALNGAMDARDAAALRRLLAEYRASYPEDSLGLQAGYELIADCLDHPRAETESAARRYYETETASTLRRYVRRHCLTPERSP